MADVFPIDEAFFEGDAQSTSRSPKAQRRAARKAVKSERNARRAPKILEPRTAKQADYRDSLLQNSLTFAIGPAGVGKTYVPARVFGEMLVTGQIEKVYCARPPVSKPKHRMGFLPGDMQDKTDPWLVPIYEGLRDAMGSAAFEEAKKSGRIEVVPFEFIQGRTFKKAACIVDEAENLDIDDLYITLTRQGDDLHMAMCGDINQARIPDSGLGDVIQIGLEDGHEGTGIIVFDENDVVRSRQAEQWVRSFAKRPGLLGFKKVHIGQNILQQASLTGNNVNESNTGSLPAFLTQAA